jgi:hypothetical protein
MPLPSTRSVLRARGALLVALAPLVGCRSAPTAAPPVTASTEAPAPASSGAEAPVVQGREAPSMPVCTASDALVAAPLAESLAATPALARNGATGLVAFITRPDNGPDPVLALLSLNAEGAPTDASGSLRDPRIVSDAGASPTGPALVAHEDGYLLVWRHGTRGQHGLSALRLDAEGAPRGAVTALVRPGGTLGVPAVAVDARGGRWVAVTRASGAAGFDTVVLVGPEGPPREIAAPAGGVWDGDAPVLVPQPTGGVAVYATLAPREAGAEVERSLLRVDGEAPALVARDLDRPDAMPLGADGVLWAWRARVARRDAALRVVTLLDDLQQPHPPLSLATFRGAFDLRPHLVTLGAHRGVLSLSLLGDEPVGALTLALLGGEGAAVGRAPELNSFAARSGRLAVASAPRGSTDTSVWVAADGRAGTQPRLLVTRVQCDAGRAVEPLDIPQGAFVQDVAPGDAAPAQLARGDGASGGCTVRQSGTLVTHLSGVDDDPMQGTSTAVVNTPTDARVFVLARGAGQSRARLSTAALGARGGFGPLRPVVDGARALLAAGSAHGGALAVATYAFQDTERLDLVFARGAAVSHQLVPTGLRNPTSAVVDGSGAVLAVGQDDNGRTILARINTAPGGRAGPVLTVATLRPGDAVRDVVREGDALRVLLARPDSIGAEVSQAVAVLTLRDGAAARAGDPFADPAGFPRGAVALTRAGGTGDTLGVMHTEGNSLRITALDGPRMRGGANLLDAFPGGGRVLGHGRAGSAHWVALATGAAGESASVRAITLARMEGGAVRALSVQTPDDASAVAAQTAVAGDGNRVIVVYPRPSADTHHALAWNWLDATCPAGASR